jgi:tetratricopeptide (TPR) repeat protein
LNLLHIETMKIKILLLLALSAVAYMTSLRAQETESRDTLPAGSGEVESLLAAAEAAYMTGQHEKAIGQYEIILQMKGVDSVQRSLASGYAGLCNQELGKNREALAYYREAILLQVPRLDIYERMITLAKQEKDHSAYEFALIQKMEAFPDLEISAIQSLAYHYYNTKQYEKLLECTEQLTEWLPRNAKFHYFSAVAKQKTGDIEGARVAFKTTLEIDPGHAGANMGLGMILYNEATELFTEAIKEYESIKDPDRVDYYHYNKSIEKPQEIYRQAIPYLLKAYEDKFYSGLRGAIYNSYMRLEDMENANKYKSE